MRKYFSRSICLLFVLLNFSCYKESVQYIEGDFIIVFDENKNSAPTKITIKNNIKGADSYSWEFDGGSPSLYSGFNPPEIFYQNEGSFLIKLKATNIDNEEKIIEKRIQIGILSTSTQNTNRKKSNRKSNNEKF